MAVLDWDPSAQFYTKGVDRLVSYAFAGTGYTNVATAIPGLVSVQNIIEPQSDFEEVFYDGVLISQKKKPSRPQLKFSVYNIPLRALGRTNINSILYPTLFAYGGAPREVHFSYRETLVKVSDGREVYVYHLIYNALASINERQIDSYSDDATPAMVEIDIVTRPEFVSNPAFGQVSHVTVESRHLSTARHTSLTDVLYGTSTTDATIPRLDQLGDYS